jgi:MFS transporter, FHS family, glucose/mannose:H+ symporter
VNRRALFTIACLGMLAFGIALTTLGSVLPSVVERFAMDKTAAGALLTLMSFGILVGSLVFGPIVDARGYRGMMLLSFVLIVAGLFGIAFAPSAAWLRVAIALIGFAGGMMNGGGNALVADISVDDRGAGLSYLGVFFGIGAVGVPFALSALLGRFTYSTLIGAIGALVLIPTVIAAITKYPAPKQAQGFPLADARRLLSDPVLLLMGLMLFLESGIEITVGGWTSTYFKEELGLPNRQALIFLSLFWFGLMLARLALGTLLRRISATRALYICLTTAFVGSMLLLNTRSVAAAAVAVFLLGVGFAATFPLVLGFTADRYAAISGTAFSVVIVMALTGGMLFPFITGVLGERYGMRGSFIVVPVAVALIATLLAICHPERNEGPSQLGGSFRQGQ